MSLLLHHLHSLFAETSSLLLCNRYKYLRHPSYVGFFYWAIGTQLLLCNPLQIILFTCATWAFFQRRIPYEEECLRQLFPNEYDAYAAKTAVGIPFL
jgi:protein-S-isoprenylcysteine O-methyltransferase